MKATKMWLHYISVDDEEKLETVIIKRFIDLKFTVAEIKED